MTEILARTVNAQLEAVFSIDLAYVDRILKGVRPGGASHRATKTLGLTIPPSLLQRADQVIE